MTLRVAVVDRLPMYARGLAVTLSEHGGPAEVPTDLLEWARRPGEPLVFLGLTEEADWGLLAALRTVRADALVVGVIDVPGLAEVVRAVAAGAAGVLDRDATPAAVADVLRATLDGRSLVPLDVLRSLVAGLTAESASRPITADEIHWLRKLADGTTVPRLAQEAGYSERMMFRLLAGLYARLGVDGRTKALIRARDEGWL
ncbi:DNA-binding response regulator [Asanoa sp. NPDC049573]|uniref:DNA-binding response regulator n=1 Tax=Asanoa sp. NPDC049573 TaxID=3155396 RepID=UPI0034307FE4